MASESLPVAPERSEHPSEEQRERLVARCRVYAARELEKRGYGSLFDGIWFNFEVTTNALRTRRTADIRPVWSEDRELFGFNITLTWQYYAVWGWEDYTDSIRHELAHAVELVKHGETGHGDRFREYAEEFDTTVVVGEDKEDVFDHRYTMECVACGMSDVRDRASRPVKHPDEYECPKCSGDLRIRHNSSGRRWGTHAEYEQIRDQVEKSDDLSW